MTRAKDISKIITDADFSGTLDVTGTVTAHDIAISDTSPTFTMTDTDTNALFRMTASSAVGSVTLEVDENGVGSNPQFLIQGQNVDRFRIDTDNGDISFYEDTGTTPKLFWDASEEILGIGTSSPTDVRLTLFSGGSGTAGQLKLGFDSNDFFQIGRNDIAGTGGGNFQIKPNGGTSIFDITSSGNVGIGTSSPDGLLTLLTANSSTPRLRLQHPTNNADATIDTYYDGSGTYLSIGTNVYQGSSAALTKFDSAKGAGLTYYDSSGQILFYNGGGGASISERMRIDTSGRFLLGTGAAIANAGGAIFQSSQQVNNWTSYIENYISSGNVYGQLIRFSGQSPDNNLSAFLACQDSSGTVRFYVYSDGDVANHDNSYGAISDEKLKEQITDASSQWDDVKALRVRKFKLKEDVSTKGDSDNLWRLGVVAQEVETAGMNGLVKDNPDLIENEDGQLVAGNTTTKSVKYSILYMKAVKALQEAMTRIETLETANTALEARIVALETA